jgi:Fe-S cluster assembly iron-binding protein IscA
MVVTDSEGTKYKNYVTVSYEDGKIGTYVELKEGNKKASVISGSSIN